MTTIKEAPAAAAVSAATEAIKEHLGPALEVLEENVRRAQRAIVQGRHAAEDLVDLSTLRVRRHPLCATATAAGVGALVGCVLAFAIGRGTHPKP